MGARRLVPTRRRGRAWGVPGLTEPGGRDGAGGDGDERELEGWGGGMVGRAGAGRLVFRVKSSAEAVVSVGLLLTLGEVGLGNSDSVLSLTAIEAGAGVGAGVAAGAGTATGGTSSETCWPLTFSWAARPEKMPDTLKLISPGKRVSAFCISASTTPTT